MLPQFTFLKFREGHLLMISLQTKSLNTNANPTNFDEPVASKNLNAYRTIKSQFFVELILELTHSNWHTIRDC
jgi:hypothetical protein